LLRIC